LLLGIGDPHAPASSRGAGRPRRRRCRPRRCRSRRFPAAWWRSAISASRRVRFAVCRESTSSRVMPDGSAVVVDPDRQRGRNPAAHSPVDTRTVPLNTGEAAGCPRWAEFYAVLSPYSWPLVRVATGLFFVPHGMQKLVGFWGRPSRPDATCCSREDAGAEAVARLPVQTSAPSFGRFRRRGRAHARQAVPRHRGSSA
jgi:hypothetical protein